MKKSKVLALTLCAALLVATTVLGTMAYLTSQASVTNTFTVGQVVITMDEAKVETDGTPIAGADRVTANVYHLIPGKSYTKDPTIHVDAKSEDCYLFVKVENGIAAYEAATVSGAYTSIAEQVAANGWTALTSGGNVFYKEYDKDAQPVVRDYPVFAEFKVDGNANNVLGWDTIATNAKITVTGYAVQAEGFADAATAWAATFGSPATPNP